MLLACGTKGKRYSLPHSRIPDSSALHERMGGQATDIDIYAREILRMRESLNQNSRQCHGQPPNASPRDVDRDYILEPNQALEYGLIDRIISTRSLEPVPVPTSSSTGILACVDLSAIVSRPRTLSTKNLGQPRQLLTRAVVPVTEHPGVK